MLKQILETMYVDPELLELMSDDQKELLFRQMREEQLRRWKKRDAELQRRPQPKRTPRKIQFLLGRDGHPWTWVMGEHRDDLSYEELVRRREMKEREEEEEEEREIRKEAEQLAKQETSHILALASRFGEVRSRSPSPSPKFPKRLSVDDGANVKHKTPVRRLVSDTGRARAGSSDIGRMSPIGQFLAPPSSPSGSMPRTESQLDLTSDQAQSNGSSPGRGQDDLRKKTLIKQVPMIGKTSEDHKKFEQKRAEELYVNLREVKQMAKKRSEAMTKGVEERWKQSEEKAKAFEKTRRASFNKARKISREVPKITEKQILEGISEERQKELERKLSDRSKPRRPVRPAPPKPLVRKSSFVLPDTQPKSPSHVVIWFREHEAPNGKCRERDGSISVWFHGILNRQQAVALLDRKPVGSYLVRLSARIWGYTISVKTYTEVKHFLVDASTGQYQFMGPKQKQFHSLPDLMKFYRVNPITTVGQEVLLLPVAQLESEDSEHFRGLFTEPENLEQKATYL